MYSGFDRICIEYSKSGWYWWVEKQEHCEISIPRFFKSAADAEQDLITFLKNYEGFRNG